VLQTYTTYHAQNAWARIQDVGWRQIETGSADGVTHMFLALCDAQANKRNVNVNGSKIYRMYLLLRTLEQEPQGLEVLSLDS